jgi:hypothetical protein
MPSDADVISRAGRLQAMTGFTPQAFEALLPQVEHALGASRQDRPSDGPPRARRRYTTDAPGPVPTTAANPLVMLTDVQQHPRQAVPGPLCGLAQAHAKTWRHRLPPVWKQALAHPELLPARTAHA